jgi:hypothetical protein
MTSIANQRGTTPMANGGSPNPTATPTIPARPNPFQLLFHIGKTVRLSGALLADGHISIFRKILFVGSLFVLVLALLAPETVGAAVTSILPLLGIAELPADAALDWVVVAVAAYNLLRVFPDEVVADHYARIFHAPRPPQQQLLPPRK